MAPEAASSATPTVNFITGNQNKLSEVKAILEPTITVRSEAIDVLEVQGSLEEVTIAKCKSAAEQVSFDSARSLYHTYLILTYHQAKIFFLLLTKFAHFLGRRSCSGGGHMPLFQRPERAAWTIHVRYHPPPHPHKYNEQSVS